MGTQQIKDYLHSRTGNLALTYLCIIMAMTLVFSIIIFSIASRQFDRPLESHGPSRIMASAPEGLRDLLDQRAADARAELLLSLMVLNIGMLGFGIWFSTYLAARTMAPIEQAMQQQAQFVSDASHELRTPLTALTSLNEVALRRKSKINDTEARELAAKNVTETSKLYQLTSSLLGLVHAEHNQTPTTGPVDLQRVVGDAMEHCLAQAQAKFITVEDTVPNVQVRTNAELVTQVVKILLENAVKYSNRKSTVTIKAKIQNYTAALSISDQGIGIAEQDIPRIFNRFFRADQSRNKQKNEGYGIGLAIAKTISDQLGMNIQAKSKVGKGSVFTIELPLAKEE